MAYTDSLLGNGEEKLYETHPSWTTLAERITLRLMAIVALLVLGIFVRVKIGAKPAGNIALIVALVVAGFFLIQVTIQFLRWRNDRYLITDRRVIQVSGVLGKHSVDSSLNMINDLVLNQTVFGRIFNYGDLQIVTGNDIGEDTLQKVADPLAFKRAVLAARESYLERINGGFYHTQPLPTAAPAPAEDVTALIAKLADLRDRGAISQAEFDAKRAELLNRI